VIIAQRTGNVSEIGQDNVIGDGRVDASGVDVGIVAVVVGGVPVGGDRGIVEGIVFDDPRIVAPAIKTDRAVFEQVVVEGQQQAVVAGEGRAVEEIVFHGSGDVGGVTENRGSTAKGTIADFEVA